MLYTSRLALGAYIIAYMLLYFAFRGIPDRRMGLADGAVRDRDVWERLVQDLLRRGLAQRQAARQDAQPLPQVALSPL